MTYLQFLAQWYNWPYLAALLLAGLARFVPGAVRPLARPLARGLGLSESSDRAALSVFGVVLGIVGLTLNGGLYDYLPRALPLAFFPAFLLSLLSAAVVTRRAGRVLERHFPEIRAVGLGARDLAGSEGRVVSRFVGPEYRAGRAQVMQEDGTLHMVLCKTRRQEIPYGAFVVLRQYDPEDARYFVEPVGTARTGAAEAEAEAERPD